MTENSRSLRFGERTRTRRPYKAAVHFVSRMKPLRVYEVPSRVLSTVTRPISNIVAWPLDRLAGGRIRTGGYSRQIWLALVCLAFTGWLCQTLFDSELLGAGLLAVATFLGLLFAVLRHGPPVGEAGGPKAAIRSFARIVRHVVLGWRNYWRYVPFLTAFAVVLVGPLGVSDPPTWWIIVIALGLTAAAIGSTVAFRAAFGPFHPESVVPSGNARSSREVVEWIWSGAVKRDEAGDTHTAAVVARLHRFVGDALVAPPELIVTADTQDGQIRIEATHTSEGDHIYRFDMEGVPSDGTYTYELEVQTASGIGRKASTRRGGCGSFRTPAADQQTLKIAFASCASTGSNGSVFDAIRRSKPDLFVHLGDLHYENISHDNDQRRLEAFGAALSSPAQSRLYREVPVAYTWDDHDYGGNNSDAFSVGRSSARRVYRQVVPHCLPGSDHRSRDSAIYQAFSLGPVRIILTDTRSERHQETGRIMTTMQERWLLKEIEEASHSHPVIVWCCSTPWIADAEHGPDTWAAFADQQNRIAEAIARLPVGANDKSRLVYLNGDAHLFAISDSSDGEQAGEIRTFPVVNAAALDRRGSYKGGVYGQGRKEGAGQFGELQIEPSAGDPNRLKVTICGRDYTYQGNAIDADQDNSIDEVEALTFDVPARVPRKVGQRSRLSDEARFGAPPSELLVSDVPCDGGACYDETWLYFSGGSLRSGLGALGAVFFLNGDEAAGTDAWKKVTRIASVSGGSLENTALSRLSSGDDLAAHFWHGFHRLTNHGGLRHYWRTLGVGALGLLAIGLTLLPWFSLSWPAFGHGLWMLPVLLVSIGAVQVLARSYLKQRIAWITTPPDVPTKADEHRDRLHIYSTVDMRSGLPAYFAKRRERMILAHDRDSVVNQVDFYEAAKPLRLRLGWKVARIGQTEPGYASSIWPFVGLPFWRKFERFVSEGEPVERSEHEPHWAGWDGELMFDQRHWAADDDGSKKAFALMDGGLAGTLGSHLDPVLYRGSGLSVMRRIATEGSFATESRPESVKLPDDDRVRRIVVDAGEYLGITSTWWLGLIWGISSLKTTHRSMKVSLNSLITIDRQFAADPNQVWYVPVTGAGRQFKLRIKHGASVYGNTTSVNVGRGLTELTARRGRSTFHTTGSGDGAAEDQLMVNIIEELRRRAELVGVLGSSPSKHGLACAASGVAGSFVEAQGVGGNLQQLVELLQSFETSVLQRGGLDTVLCHAVPCSRYRWEQLDNLHLSSTSSHRGHSESIAISHRGDTSQHVGEDVQQARDNTLLAFQRAHEKGFRVMECDVQVVEDQLVALHSFFGWIWHRSRPRRISKMRLVHLEEKYQNTGGITTLEELVVDKQLQDVTWNFEAKDRESMPALVAWLGKKSGQKSPLDPPPIISGGWRRKRLVQARRENPTTMTAQSLGDYWRLWRKQSAPHVAVAQFDYRFFNRLLLPFLGYRAAAQARTQRIHVQWYNVNSTRSMRRIHNRFPRDGISTDKHDRLKDVLGLE